jgi:hypothetical protein
LNAVLSRGHRVHAGGRWGGVAALSVLALTLASLPATATTSPGMAAGTPQQTSAVAEAPTAQVPVAGSRLATVTGSTVAAAAVSSGTAQAAGNVQTLAGGSSAVSKAGTGTGAGFASPAGVVAVGGFVYVGTADTIMKVDPTTKVATVLAGLPGSPGNVDASTGAAARVASVKQLVSDGQYLYFLQSSIIRRLTLATGAVSSTTVGSAESLAMGPDGFVYFASRGVIYRMDPATGTVTHFVDVTGSCWGDSIGGMSADATTLWIADIPVNCGDYATVPLIRSYSLSTGAVLANYPISADTRAINWANDSVPVLSVGGLVYIAYAGWNAWSHPDNYCWPTEMFALDKASGATTVVGGPAPVLGNDATTGSCDFSDVDGVGLSAQFSGISQIASDGVNLYTVGANATNNRVRVIKASPVAAPLGGVLTARENPGTANFCAACAAAETREALVDPVDTAAGAFSESFVDLAISGRGPQAVWARSYTSVMAGDDGPLGFGWHTGYGAHLVIDGVSGNVTVSQETGAESVFTNTAGVFSAPGRTQASLVKKADGSYVFVRKASQTLTFTAAGVLTSIADLNGVREAGDGDRPGRSGVDGDVHRHAHHQGHGPVGPVCLLHLRHGREPGQHHGSGRCGDDLRVRHCPPPHLDPGPGSAGRADPAPADHGVRLEGPGHVADGPVGADHDVRVHG